MAGGGGGRRAWVLRPVGVALACTIALSSCGGPSLSSIESRLSHLHTFRSATHAQLACAAKVFRRDISASNIERWIQGKVDTSALTAHHRGIGLAVMASCAGKKTTSSPPTTRRTARSPSKTLR